MATKRGFSPTENKSSGPVAHSFPSDETTRAFGLHAQNTSKISIIFSEVVESKTITENWVSKQSFFVLLWRTGIALGVTQRQPACIQT